MIINPLTGKSIKASGKLAKQLYQMHKEKRIKLKRQDIQTMKECMVNKQHGGGGTCATDIPEAKYLNNDVMEKIGNRLNFVDLTKLAATNKNYVKVFKNAIIDQKTIIESGTLEQRIDMLKGVLFSCYTLGNFQQNTALGTLVKECATFEDEGLFKEYRSMFKNYNGGYRLLDDNDPVWKNEHTVIFKTRCQLFWILGAISACIDDPHELITIYDDIYEKYDNYRQQNGIVPRVNVPPVNVPLDSVTQQIPTKITETSTTLLKIRNSELSDIEKEEQYDTISKTELAGLNLETIINYLQLFTLHNMQKHGMY